MLDFFIYILVGVLFVLAAFAAAYFLSPHNPCANKLLNYECGEEPVGNSWIQFNPRFYLIGLVYVIFDVGIIFLVPWALVAKTLGAAAFMTMLFFIMMLVLGLAYAWRKGVLEWT